MPTKAVVPTLLWMTGWLASMLVMMVAGRESLSAMPVHMLMFFRAAIGLPILLAIAAYFGFEGIKTGQFARHATRSSFHFVAQLAWFSALALIPIAQVVSIEFTMPIWAALIASVYLAEKLTGKRMIAIALGFLGILIIVRPGMSEIKSGQLLALTSAIGFAVSVVMTKQLLKRDTAFTTLFYMLAVQFVLACFVAAAFWHWPDKNVWLWVFGAGLGGLSAHYCLARALDLADASTITQIDFARVPLAALVAWLVYNEGVDIFLAIGAGLILLGNLVNLRGKKA